MTEALFDSLNRIWLTLHAKVLLLVPRLLAALAVFLAGLVLGALLRAIVRRSLKLARFDQRLERSGLSPALRQPAWTGPPPGWPGGSPSGAPPCPPGSSPSPPWRCPCWTG